VLFLFVIMFLGVDRSMSMGPEPLPGQRGLAAVGVVITIAGIITLLARSHWVTGATSVAGKLTTSGAETKQLGTAIFTTYLYAFEATAALLIIAVVGAVLMARRERRSFEEPEVTSEEVSS